MKKQKLGARSEKVEHPSRVDKCALTLRRARVGHRVARARAIGLPARLPRSLMTHPHKQAACEIAAACFTARAREKV